jgi:hypothetical protein
MVTLSTSVYIIKTNEKLLEYKNFKEQNFNVSDLFITNLD